MTNYRNCTTFRASRPKFAAQIVSQTGGVTNIWENVFVSKNTKVNIASTEAREGVDQFLLDNSFNPVETVYNENILAIKETKALNF